MNFLIGLLIAVAVGLTGIGGGSFTVPALVFLAGLTAEKAVGTGGWRRGCFFFLTGAHWTSIPLL